MTTDLDQLEIDRSRVTGILQQYQSDNSLGFRVRSIVNNNPYMSNNMGAVMQMAQSDLSDLEIHRNSGAIYGAITADTLRSQLVNYDESIQRSIFANLTPQQQGALVQQGYEQPKSDSSDGDGFWSDAFGLITKPLGAIVRGAGSIPGATGLVQGGLSVLKEASNVPFWMYRSAVNQSWEERLIGAAAAGITVAGLLAAPVTGGTSAVAGAGARMALLRIIGSKTAGMAVKGLTAVTAANVAQGASQVLTGNADDWWHTFSDAKNGERFFKIESVKQAEELLQDSRLTNLATRVALEFEDFSLLDVTKDVAESGLLTAQTMTSIADDLAEPGSEEHQELVLTLTSLLENPIFQDAVNVLQKGKISLGRSIASSLQVFDEDSDMYRYISGSIDAASWFVFDPFMAASKISKSSKILRQGFANINDFNEVALIDRFSEIAKVPEVRRSYEIFAQSINENNVALMNRFVPWMRNTQLEYRSFLLAENKGSATADNFVEWVVGSNQLKMIMQGKGIVHGSRDAVFVRGISKSRELVQTKITGPAKDLIDGIQFSDNLRVISKMSGRVGVSPLAQVNAMMDNALIDGLPDIEKLRVGNALNQGAFDFGASWVKKIPGAKMFANMVTDLNTLVAGKSIALNDAEDIKKYIDLFAAGQVPKHVRDLWVTAISGTVGQGARLSAIQAFNETMFAAIGLTSTEKGFKFAQEYLHHANKVYHVGPIGAGPMGPRTVLQINTADKIVVPNLQEIRNAVDAEIVTRHLLGIVESPFISAFQNRFWKPSVLLRVGFITRNASEDMIGFIARNGIGHLNQNYAARSVYKGRVAENLRNVKPGQVPSQVEKFAVERDWALMSWMRPIENIMSRFEGDVVNHFLVKKTKSLRLVAANGLNDGAGKNLPIFQWLVGADKGVGTDAFSLLNVQIRATEAIQKLALGGQYSSRRMLLGGVDNELYISAEKYFTTYQKTLMDQIGSTTTMAPFAGQFSDNVQVSVSGSFDIMPSSAEGGPEAIVRNMQHHMEDPGFRYVADENLRYLPPEIASNLTPDQLRNLLKSWKMFNFDPNDDLLNVYLWLTESVITHTGKLATTTPQRWQMLLTEMKRRGTQQKLFKRLEAKFQGEKVPTWEDLVFENSGGGGWGRTTQSQQTYDDLIDFHNTHIATISDETTKGHIRNNLVQDNKTNGLHLPIEEINAMGTGDNLYGPFTLDKTVNDKRLKDAALLEINERTGSFANLPKLKEFEDKAVGTRVHVIDFTDDTNTFLDPNLLIGTLLKTDGSIETAGVAYALGLDTNTMSLIEQKNLEGIVQDIIDAIMKRDKLILHTPELRYSPDVTNSLHGYLNNIFATQYKRTIKKPLSANIPISNTNQLDTLFPTVGAFNPGVKLNKGGKVKLSTAKWDSANYPLAGDYLTAATGDIGNEQIIDDLINLYQEMTQSHVRYGFKTRDRILYEKVADKPVQVASNTELINLQYRQFYSDSEFKNPIKLGNQQYFEQMIPNYGPNSETLHSFVQPAHYDVLMRDRKAVLRQPTSGSLKHYFDIDSSGKVVQRDIVVDYTDSIILNEAYLDNLPAEFLPNYTIKSLEEASDMGTFDTIVKKGFGYMGAAIDAIAREPMAFHAFHVARLRNKKNVEWLFKNTSANMQLGQAIDDAIASKVFPVAQVKQLQKFGDVGRMAGKVQNIPGAEKWTNREAFAFLKGFTNTQDDFIGLLDNLRVNIIPGKTAPQQKALIKFLEAQQNKLSITLPFDATTSEFLLSIDALLGQGSALAGKATRVGVPKSNLLTEGVIHNYEQIVDDIGWDIVQQAAKSKELVKQNADDYAAEFAINDIMPFIDTHQIRSQFSENMRGFLPFWYATENFLKRWAKMFTIDGVLGGAALARKLTLTQNGLRTMGIVRQDAQGKDYFVYPGSDLFIDVIGKLPFMGTLMPVQAMLQTPTDKLVPGFSTTNFGAPGLTPLAGVSMEVFGFIFPELPFVSDDLERSYDDLKTSLLGDIQQTRDVLDYILPSGVINTFGAITNIGVGEERIASAMMSALAHLEATGNGLPDGASAAEIDEHIRNARNHARIIVFSQALAGWFTPGPASGLQTTEDQSSISWLTEGKIENPAELLSGEYYSLISTLGIEEGTQKYLELYKTNTINNIINPSAFTVSKTETRGKAVLAGTEESVDFYLDNKEIMDTYPTAAAWLLPQANTKDKRSKYAYDSEVINGFRDMKTSEAFLNELKFKEASHNYFKAKDNYEIKINELNSEGDFSLAKQYSADWDRQSVLYKSAHPIFTQYLEAGDARQRRDVILGELRYAFDDPLFPKAAHFNAMKEMLVVFDEYLLEKRRLGLSGSGINRIMKSELEESFIFWAENHIKLNPGVETFYNTVIQPEAGL